MPKSNFNGRIEQSNRAEFSSPKHLPKNFSHGKSASMHQEYAHKSAPTVEDDDEEHTALMLPHLMLSKSNFLPQTTSPQVSSSTSSSQANSFRALPNIDKSSIENLDIYEDPSQHYGVIGNPMACTTFQTSTPARNTVSNNLRDHIANRGKRDVLVSHAPSNSLSGIGYGKLFLAYMVIKNHGFSFFH